ncbi:hypothetical protein Nepgr_026557 [Nepenthes gracilis]|uniref:Uncharacterized protein n=1 Tax=Nepenthes gracilis TaxID=150966 RepID=A0AAD3T8L9_NEPGR|nr:hypothetical protein Nepgr_026557 [Nepenthes gracilis]
MSTYWPNLAEELPKKLMSYKALPSQLSDVNSDSETEKSVESRGYYKVLFGVKVDGGHGRRITSLPFGDCGLERLTYEAVANIGNQHSACLEVLWPGWYHNVVYLGEEQVFPFDHDSVNLLMLRVRIGKLPLLALGKAYANALIRGLREGKQLSETEAISLSRVGNDFGCANFPGKPDDIFWLQGYLMLQGAYNSLWLGNYKYPDGGMIQSTHPCGAFNYSGGRWCPKTIVPLHQTDFLFNLEDKVILK